jgi:hypothetical protein
MEFRFTSGDPEEEVTAADTPLTLFEAEAPPSSPMAAGGPIGSEAPPPTGRPIALDTLIARHTPVHWPEAALTSSCCSGFRVPGSGFSFEVRGSKFRVLVRGSRLEFWVLAP